ncbi:MAG: DUF2007 domain-containing protein [Chitinophagaceae bacterium]|jgi:predicted RNA-binding Zn-ribbon protein involved in translation (DUF1610 family)|nr:DUF2007 domain-containing protein [Chitinophagaceae bacterium]
MEFIPVFTYNDYVSAHIAMGRLEEDGIDCWLKDENTVTINAAWTQAVGGIKLMVAEDHVAKAVDILKEIDRQHKATITCPKCGSHNIELVSTPRKASNWVMVIFGFLFTSYAMPVDMANHCFDCGHEFPEAKAEEVVDKDQLDN